jgi:serine/threonine-protein kinase
VRDAPAVSEVVPAEPAARLSGETWRTQAGLRKQLPALVLFLFGAGLTGVLFAFLRVRDREQHRAEFERQANHTTTELRARLELPLEVLQSIARFFDASEEVTRGEFRLFVKAALERHPGTRALEWIPVVPGSERARYEARARADGLANFAFKEEGAGLSLVEAGKRAEYQPIYYMEPPDPSVLGFDVAANPARRAPTDRARETMSLVASERIRLVEDPPEVYSVAVFQPVRRHVDGEATGPVSGFAAEVFRVRTLVGPIVRDLVQQGVGVVLEDPPAPPALRLLFESVPHLSTLPASDPRERYTARFPFADRTWAVTFLAAPRRDARSGWPWATLLSGLAISALLSLILSASTLIYRLRRQVNAALQLGQYTLLEKLGEGGMGMVYQARHSMLRRPTAIKLLPPERRDARDIQRFEREVQLTSRLSHPNTIAVYDYGRTPDGIFYYAMEFIDGITLEDLVTSEGALPVRRAIRILIQVCGALAEAHEAGIIHRDVKPANLMIMERGGIPDFVKVLDFGLVKENTEEGSLGTSLGTSRGTPLLGTPLYLSPEAISTGVVDARADLYSLGAAAYFLVTGVTVFHGANVVEVCAEHLYATPLPPSARTRAEIPPSVDALILQCLAKKPEERPGSALALADGLRSLEQELGAFTDDEARAWWRDRGRTLVKELRARRRTVLPDGGRATLAVDPKRAWEGP